MDVFSTMNATMSDLGDGWPYYTQPDFEVFGKSFLKGSGADIVSWSPVVAGEEERRAWGNYSTMNAGWVEQGLNWQAQHEGIEMPTGPFEIPSYIYTKGRSDNVVTAEAGSGPFLPVWQMAGAPSDPSVVNFNLLSDADILAAFTAARERKTQTLTKIVNASWLYGESASTVSGEQIPQSLLLTPLFEDAMSSKLAGVVVAVLSWGSYFENVLHEGSPEVHVVVSTGECGDLFTLKVLGGAVSFAGEGEKHDRKFNEHGVSSTLGSEICTYKMTVYPSQDFVETYNDKEPIYWTLFVVGIILVVLIAFVVYDIFAQKRQFKYLSSAAKSQAIVASLFPEEVQDRLFGKDAEGKKEPEHYQESSKFRLRHYLDTENAADGDNEEGSAGKISVTEQIPDANGLAPNASTGMDMYQTKPIADLFPNTTIMFADIAG